MPHGGEPRRNVRENRWGLLPRAQEDRASYSNQENAARRQFFAAMPHELKHRKQQRKRKLAFPQLAAICGRAEKRRGVRRRGKSRHSRKKLSENPDIPSINALERQEDCRTRGNCKERLRVTPRRHGNPDAPCGGVSANRIVSRPPTQRRRLRRNRFRHGLLSKTHITASSALAGCEAAEANAKAGTLQPCAYKRARRAHRPPTRHSQAQNPPSPSRRPPHMSERQAGGLPFPTRTGMRPSRSRRRCEWSWRTAEPRRAP